MPTQFSTEKKMSWTKWDVRGSNGCRPPSWVWKLGRQLPDEFANRTILPSFTGRLWRAVDGDVRYFRCGVARCGGAHAEPLGRTRPTRRRGQTPPPPPPPGVASSRGRLKPANEGVAVTMVAIQLISAQTTRRETLSLLSFLEPTPRRTRKRPTPRSRALTYAGVASGVGGDDRLTIETPYLFNATLPLPRRFTSNTCPCVYTHDARSQSDLLCRRQAYECVENLILILLLNY